MINIELARFETSDGKRSRFIIDLKHNEIFSTPQGKTKVIARVLDIIVDELEENIPDVGPWAEPEREDEE